MRLTQLPFAAALGLLGIFGATPAAAQTTASQPGYTYDFDDDYMVGDTLASPPPILTGGKKGMRIMLIRPRASFVAEMLKSVELM
jgi:hypothetical protein